MAVHNVGALTAPLGAFQAYLLERAGNGVGLSSLRFRGNTRSCAQARFYRCCALPADRAPIKNGYGLPDRLSNAAGCAVVDHDPASRGQEVGVDLRAFSLCGFTTHQGGGRRRSEVELLWSQQAGGDGKAHGRWPVRLRMRSWHKGAGRLSAWSKPKRGERERDGRAGSSPDGARCG